VNPKHAKSGGTIYVAWLRAINVGGNRMVKMDDLKTIFTGLKFGNVRTLINSGNVVFEAPRQSEAALRTLLETTLEKKLGFDVTTLVRTSDELEALVAFDPFKDVTDDENPRLYVTFLAAEPTAAQWKALQAIANPDQQFTKRDRELFTVYRVAAVKKEPFSNALMEKILGTRATTRGWPTVVKALALARA
jgi:uncharacterized protein (DUF1697 family)